MKHKKTMYLLLVFVLAVSLCGAFPSEVFAAKALKGTLSGVVVDQSGKPVSNTQVYIYQRDWSNTDGMGIPDWKSLAGQTVTGRNGAYKIALPAGEYRVLFVPSDLDKYAMEAYPDAPIVRLGDSVTVRYGRTTGAISVKLDPSGKIGGYLFDTIPGFDEPQPLPNTPLAICHQEYSYINCFHFTSTNADGYYEFKGLKAYPWQLWVNCPFIVDIGGTEPWDAPNYRSNYKGYITTLTGQYSWLPTAGQTFVRDPISLEYDLFVNITGTLRYFDEVANDYLPVVGVTVRAEFADDPMNIQDWGSEYYEATTDENGQFEIRGFSQYFGVFVIRTDGFVGENQVYYDEYNDNRQEQWDAYQYDLNSGTTKDVGVWMLDKIPEGQNP